MTNPRPDVLPFDEPSDSWGLRHGSYWLPDIDGKRTRYQRVTTFAGLAESTYNLERWKMRGVAYGVARRRDLAALAASCSDISDTTLNDVAEAALEHSQVGAAANLGTAVHAESDRVDRGGDVAAIVDPLIRRDVEAYLGACRAVGLEVLPDAIETVVINDTFTVAGRLDRLMRVSRPIEFTYDGIAYQLMPGDVIVVDLKTGKKLQYAMPAIEIQFESYSGAQRWWTGGGTWAPAPYQVHRGIGLIAHVPEGSGQCALRPVDLGAGHRGGVIAGTVRGWRSHRPKFEAIYETVPPVAGRTLLDDINDAPHVEALNLLWRDNARHWAPEHTQAAAARKRALSGGNVPTVYDRETAA